MTSPAPHGPGFGMHEPSMKSTNADAETVFIISCTMAFPYSRCSLVLFLKSQAVTNKMFVFLVLANKFCESSSLKGIAHIFCHFCILESK